LALQIFRPQQIFALRGAPSDSILDFSNKPPTVGPGALFPGMKRQYINLLRWLLS